MTKIPLLSFSFPFLFYCSSTITFFFLLSSLPPPPPHQQQLPSIIFFPTTPYYFSMSKSFFSSSFLSFHLSLNKPSPLFDFLHRPKSNYFPPFSLSLNSIVNITVAIRSNPTNNLNSSEF